MPIISRLSAPISSVFAPYGGAVAVANFEDNITNAIGNDYSFISSGTISYTNSMSNFGKCYSAINLSAVYVSSNIFTDLTKDYTLNVWCKLNSSGPSQYRRLYNIVAYRSGTPVYSGLDIDGNQRLQLTLENYGLSNLVSQYTYADGNWHMVTVKKLNDKIFVYIDYTKEIMVRNLTTANYIRDFTYIGVSHTSYSAGGYIDQFAIWTRALSDPEINYIYNSGQGRAAF